MLCRLRFSKSFQSDNHVYCNLNNSTLDFFYLVLSKLFLNSETVLVIIEQLVHDVIHQLIIKLDKTDKYKPTLIVKDIMEQT